MKLMICEMRRVLTPIVLVAGLMPVMAGTGLVRGDFDGDGKDDVFGARDGVFYLRSNAGAGGQAMEEASFKETPAYLDPDTMKVADVDQDGYEDVLMASRQANRLLVVYGQAVLTEPLRTLEVALAGGPAGAGAGQWIGTGPLEMMSVLPALPAPVLAVLDSGGGLAGSYGLPSGAAGWSSVDVGVARNVPGAMPQFGWLTLDGVGEEQLWWAEFAAGSPGSGPVLTTNRLVRLGRLSAGLEMARAGGRLGHGRLLIGSEQGQWVVFPAGTNVLGVVPGVVGPGGIAVGYREGLGFAGRGGAVLGDAAGDLVLVVAVDGSFARVLRWQGPGNLVVVETIPAPAGQSLVETLPLSDGSVFMALGVPGGAGGWTGFAHYNRQGTPGYTYVEEFRPGRGRGTVARVMVFDRDPFGGGALEWESFGLDGWALSARVEGGAVAVRYQPDAGAPGGLGEETETSLTPHRVLPVGAVALANQWEPDSSVFFGVAPSLAGGAGVRPEPGPGSYGGPIEVRFIAGEKVGVRYRLGNGNWQTGPGPVAIGQSLTLEYYGVTENGYPGPIAQVRYAIGEPGSGLPGALKEDRDGNGLDDGWERLFFGENGVDANGDADGDGSTNGEEYAGGSNPRDARSRPVTPGSERRMMGTVGPDGEFRLRLETDTGVELVPEYSEDLTQWLPLPGMPVTLPDGTREWVDAEPAVGNRYYRFTLPPE